jgi:hypothetical protein
VIAKDPFVEQLAQQLALHGISRINAGPRDP